MQKHIVILFMILFMVAIGFGIVAPVVPFYALQFGASPLEIGLLFTSFSVMQFITAPQWGRLSDRVGRRRIILLGLFGYAVSSFINGVANSLWMLYLARILGGALSSAVIPTSFAYISDVTSVKERGGGMGIMAASLSIGMAFGPSIGGLADVISIQTPFFVSATTALVTWVFAYMFLPEPPRRSTSSETSGQKLIFLTTRSPLLFFFVLASMIAFSTSMIQPTLPLYANQRFGYGAGEMAIGFTAMGSVSALAQGLLVGRTIDRFGEETLIRLGILISITGNLSLVLTGGLLGMALSMCIMGLGMALTRPGIPSLISKRTKLNQGGTMGIQSSFESLGFALGPLFGSQVFVFNLNYPFAASAVTLLSGLLLSYWSITRFSTS